MDSKNTFRKKAIIINGPKGFDAIVIKGCMGCDHLKNITPELNTSRVVCNIGRSRYGQWEWYDEIQAERPHFIFSECPLPDWDAVRWHDIKEIPRDETLIAMKLKNIPYWAAFGKIYVSGVYIYEFGCFFMQDPDQLKTADTLMKKRRYGHGHLQELPKECIESWRYFRY